jgi:hypothetical protein
MCCVMMWSQDSALGGVACGKFRKCLLPFLIECWSITTLPQPRILLLLFLRGELGNCHWLGWVTPRNASRRQEDGEPITTHAPLN